MTEQHMSEQEKFYETMNAILAGAGAAIALCMIAAVVMAVIYIIH